ncbi:MAG: 3-deoxy-D-manno-octulosonic acid transferase [Wenzhouxiangella sp.]|jgi:3-deoxy-D-manno-octulosonic-acid transferase|nr:3-deoxy-D-manno-octulosonic acid transferase [Wenzhouxiangella sp.]
MLTLYRILLWLAGPFLLSRLQRPAAARPGLARKRAERLGRLALDADSSPVWVHAASVGEVNAAQGLIRALRDAESTRIVVSTFTVTGAERVAELFGDSVHGVFAPIDTWFSVRRWLSAVRPRVCLVVETEIWPELFIQTARREIPLALVNARLTERSVQRARRVSGLFRRALTACSLAICQTRDDAKRFEQLGLPADRLHVSGNLKFDNPLPDNIGRRAQELRQQWGGRPAWVAGSTRPGEEAIILEAHRQLRTQFPEALLILAPRHPDRVRDIETLISAADLRSQRFDESVDHETSVVVVDRLGALLPCYAAASAAFVGGSLVDIGGHNLLEPAAFGKAVMAGPHLFQQADAAAALRASGALIEVENARSLAGAVRSIWENPEDALVKGRAALDVVENGRGSLRRTVRLLDPLLSRSAAR